MVLRTRAAACLILLTAIGAVYLQVRGHEFVGYDDIPQVIQAPGHCIAFSADAVAEAMRTPKYANWVPLTNITHQLDCSLHGTAPAPYLIENVVLHASCTLMLFLLLLRLTGALGPSVFVAGVFALHPLHVESVAWASGRRDVLSGLFWMACLLAYTQYSKTRSAAAYAGVVTSLLLALLAKPTAVTLPFVLLLLDYWPLRRFDGGSPGPPTAARLRQAVVEKLPLFAIVGAVSVVTYRVQEAGGNLSFGEHLSAAERLANVVVSYGSYIVNSFWPTRLAVFYPLPIAGHPNWLIGLYALLLIAISALAVRGARSHPYLIVGWLWYLGTLVPVIGFVQTEMHASADRFTYLPQIGLTIALAWGVASALPRTRPAQATVTVVAGIALLLLAAQARVQVSTWKDSIALFSHALEVTRDNHLAHYNLGAALGRAGQVEQGIAHQKLAQQIAERGLRAQAERR